MVGLLRMIANCAGCRVLAYRGALLLSLAGMCFSPATASDWPTYAHDLHRGAATDETLSLPLEVCWVHRAPHPPRPAWPPPAKNDYWHRKYGLHSRVAYDRAFQPIVSGKRLIFGTSSDDRLVCLDLQSGRPVWTFFAEGPIRLAPTCVHNRVYFGSDDGYVYCIAADSGHLVWKLCAGPTDSRIIGNGRMISRWPIRSGVAVVGKRVYCAAGLFPASEGAYLVIADAESGRLVHRQRIDQAAEGYLAVSGTRLYLPSGRTAPRVYALETGKQIGGVSSPGGTYALVADSIVATGPGDLQGDLTLSERQTQRQLVSVPGRHLLTDATRWFIHSSRSISALDTAKFLPLAKRQAALNARMSKLEKNKSANATVEKVKLKAELAALQAAMASCRLWRVDCKDSTAIIRAGSLLFAGGSNHLSAYRTTDGHLAWQTTVEGDVYGLAVASGRLVVSTSTGQIYCLGPKPVPALAETGSASSGHVRKRQRTRANQSRSAFLLARINRRKGFAVVRGVQRLQLAIDVAASSGLRVIVVEPDQAMARRARRSLMKSGLYGTRIVVHSVPERKLPYPPYFANLVVVDQDDQSIPAAVLEQWIRLLHPHGGMLSLSRGSADLHAQVAALAKRTQRQLKVHSSESQQTKTWLITCDGGLAGAGQWTHGLADPANTACSQDKRVRGPLRLQWFGGPGPRLMPDRHHRNVPPLYNNGRLIVPGDNVLLAVDAYNGTQLWQRKVPNSIRLGVFLDCTSTVLDSTNIYQAVNNTCRVYAQADGKLVRKIELPQPDANRVHKWGYVARAGLLLVGSGCRQGAAYQKQSRRADNALWDDNMSLVTSDYLFALKPTEKTPKWQYRSGVIINTTITIGGGRVYFVESHAPKALQSSDGRATMAALQPGPTFVVALDLATGTVLWKQAFSLENCRHIIYLDYAHERLVLSGNRYVNSRLWYYFYTFSARRGDLLWKTAHETDYKPHGEHGEQNRHPTIVGTTIYTYPYAYDLTTGKRLPDWKFERMGHGCGNVAASTCALFWRGGNPWHRDLTGACRAGPVNRVTRPGCFINMIPAGGLLLIPEASSGCTCQFPLQTSLAYLPESDPLMSITDQ